MSYKDLQVWKKAKEVSIEIHNMSLHLPSIELYETGSQIRRSSKSIRSNIVEGYGRKKYTKDYIRFIIYAIASKDETIDHLETLYETKSLLDLQLYKDLHDQLLELGKVLYGFLGYLENRS